MKFDKKEAREIAEKCFGRHSSPEHFVADGLQRGEIALDDLAEIFIGCYRAFHPKLIIMDDHENI